MFLETSAKTGECVEEAFLKCSKSILAKIEVGEIETDTYDSGIQSGDEKLRNLHRDGQSGRQSDCLCRM